MNPFLHGFAALVQVLPVLNMVRVVNVPALDHCRGKACSITGPPETVPECMEYIWAVLSSQPHPSFCSQKVPRSYVPGRRIPRQSKDVKILTLYSGPDGRRQFQARSKPRNICSLWLVAPSIATPHPTPASTQRRQVWELEGRQRPPSRAA